MRKNKIQERINEIKAEFHKEGKTEELIQKYNGIDYECQCAVKGAVKKVGGTNFGYYLPPALTKAGKIVLIWRAIWSCRCRKQKLSRVIIANINIIGSCEKDVAMMSMHAIRMKLREVVMTLREQQRESVKLREKWLEEMAIKNAIADGDMDAQKVLKTMLRKIHTQAMYAKPK